MSESCILNLLKNYPSFKCEEFQYIKSIGKGSFGTIWLVKEIETNKEYAIKSIQCNISELSKYINEFKILYNCQNNNIIKAYKYNISKSKDNNNNLIINFNILMEKGICDWRQEIIERGGQKKKKYYKTEEIFSILKQLTSGFDYLQKNEIAHRDIKTQNILIFPGNIYKIVDFSEAMINLKNEPKIQEIKGSQPYMSPALFHGLNFGDDTRKFNPYKSDVFSLGLCLLYAITLNERLFSFFEKIRKSREIYNEKEIKQKIESEFDVVSQYPPRLMNKIYKMIVIEEKDRYDFETLKKDLPII